LKPVSAGLTLLIDGQDGYGTFPTANTALLFLFAIPRTIASIHAMTRSCPHPHPSA